MDRRQHAGSLSRVSALAPGLPLTERLAFMPPRPGHRWKSLSICLLALAQGGEVGAADYATQIKPLLAEKCGGCHGAVRQKSRLRLDAGALILKGGKHGAAIVPGQPAASLLIEKVSAVSIDERMPPEGEGKPLTARDIALLSEWIAAGAPFPKDEAIVGDPTQFWSHQPPMKRATAVPVGETGNEFDAFWPMPASAEPDRSALLRRVHLDLTGLPPTREELRAFLADTGEGAYERVVEDLLNRPEFGERWGRHWMDVWRYCDWHGSANEIRYSQRHIWRWRDWIVRSLNADTGYDRMIVEMLAGDEIAPEDPDTVAATGFIGRNWYKFDRNVWMRELVEHTAIGFLGATLKCARCHDHKFDPLSQEDYYRFRAFFEPHSVRTDRLSAATPNEAFVDAGLPVLTDGLARTYDKTLDAPTYVFERGDDRYPIKEKAMPPGVPAILGGAAIEIRPVDLPLRSWAPMLTPEMLAELRKLADEKVEAAAPGKAQEAARAARDSLEARIAADVAKHLDGATAEKVTALAAEAAKRERAAAVLSAEAIVLEKEAALAAKKAPETEKALADAKKARDTALANAKKTDATYTPLGEVFPKTSTGRRLALARWIADPKNPRTARVAVNQVWMRHFGKALVEPVFDFGMRSGKTPEHLALLDWLAVDFMEHGWSFKHLHRQIVTSAAYRKSSVPRRLEAEAIRDSVLAISGTLDRTQGGREIPFAQDQAVPRRSLYFQTAPNRQSVWLGSFDFASTEECYERKPSVIPQQALALMNAAITSEAARRVAARHTTLEDKAYVAAAFEEILSRHPTQAEVERCVRFLEEQASFLSRYSAGGNLGEILPPMKGTISAAVDVPARRARENLAHTLFNHDEFVTLR
jgi:hypothetical protein